MQIVFDCFGIGQKNSFEYFFFSFLMDEGISKPGNMVQNVLIYPIHSIRFPMTQILAVE